MISVVIPVKNGGAALDRCLSAIDRQICEDAVEVVIVDSGSTDGSVELAHRHGARVTEIQPHTFTHGGARNLGAGEARGEYLVFISQDAYPIATDWLTRLTLPLQDPAVAGVYGRQLPHENARPPEIFFLDFLYGPDPRVQRAAKAAELSMNTTLFSNVNAAMPASVWQRFSFAEDIIMSEDQEWSQRVLRAGYELVYEPGAAVRHSHDYTVAAAFRRFFDSGVSAERSYMPDQAGSRRTVRRAAVRYGLDELRWLALTGQGRWIPYASVYESAKFAGLVLGANHRRLPLSLKRRFSALARHWDG